MWRLHRSCLSLSLAQRSICSDEEPHERGDGNFLSALKSYDSTFEEKVREMCSGEKSLRYVADLEFDYDTQRVTASIKPVAVSRDHALYWLRGKQVFVALTTSLLPAALVLKGAGQGGREGASGLLGDIIRVAQRFKAKMMH